ncbi:MAG: hypothetical protein O3A47_12825 [Chloroflexi bacterium]|nr:hypothetical protein [Chloroflexota bacterium]
MDGKVVRHLWILFRAAGAIRKFLRIQISNTDGSVYLALGDPHRNVRIAQGSITIPDGQTSASVDYTKHIVATFENFDGAHLGLKASGRVIEKFGDRHYPLQFDVPTSAPHDMLVQTIYPAPLDILPITKARPNDIVLPDRFEYRTRPGEDMETVFGTDAFHVDIWQMAAGSTEGKAAPTVVGTCSVKAGERQLVFALVQDDVDRQRGWLPGGTRVLRRLPSGARPPSTTPAR